MTSARAARSAAAACSAKARPGFTLIEMLIVVSVSSVMIGIAVTTLHLLLGAERGFSRAVRYSATLPRLAEVFRPDVHEATGAEIAGERSSRLELTSPSLGRVAYECDGHILRRVHERRDGRSHRDAFYFPPGSVLHFEHDRSPALVRLVVECATGPSGGDPPGPAVTAFKTHFLEALLARAGRPEEGAP